VKIQARANPDYAEAPYEELIVPSTVAAGCRPRRFKNLEDALSGENAIPPLILVKLNSATTTGDGRL